MLLVGPRRTLLVRFLYAELFLFVCFVFLIFFFSWKSQFTESTTLSQTGGHSATPTKQKVHGQQKHVSEMNQNSHFLVTMDSMLGKGS